MLDARSWWTKGMTVGSLALGLLCILGLALLGCGPTGGNNNNGDNNGSNNNNGGTGAATIVGTVVDATNPGTALQNVDLYVYTPPSFREMSLIRGLPGGWLRQNADETPLDTAASDDTGAYELPDIRSGQIRLVARPRAGSGFAPLECALDVPRTGQIRLRLTMVPGDLAATIAGIEITPALPTVEAGGTIDFEAMVVDTLGRTMTIAPTWIATNACGTIDDDGIFTAADEATGGAIIAVSGPRSATTAVTVEGGTAGAGVPVIEDVFVEPDAPVYPGSSVFIGILASDPDEDWLYYGCLAEQGEVWPTDMFEWFEYVAPEEEGTYTVTAIVTDGENETTQDVEITVSADAENGAPEIDGPWADQYSVPRGAYVFVECWAWDPEGEALTFDWSATDGTLSEAGDFKDDPTVRLWQAPDTAGDYEIIVTVTDESGNSTTSDLLSIEVTDEGGVGGDINVGVD